MVKKKNQVTYTLRFFAKNIMNENKATPRFNISSKDVFG